MIARRRLLALSAALPAVLAGCGWEPLYANRQTPAASADLRAIRVLPIPERVGQRLESGLRRSFNPSAEPTKQRYELKVTAATSVADLGVQSQGLGTRGEVNLSASYTLTEIGTNKVLQTGSIHASDSFDIQANGYSTVVAQDDAYTRTVEEVRREIVARLTLFLETKAVAAS
jgi:LPS-assembly lipoprotein